MFQRLSGMAVEIWVPAFSRSFALPIFFPSAGKFPDTNTPRFIPVVYTRGSEESVFSAKNDAWIWRKNKKKIYPPKAKPHLEERVRPLHRQTPGPFSLHCVSSSCQYQTLRREAWDTEQVCWDMNVILPLLLASWEGQTCGWAAGQQHFAFPAEILCCPRPLWQVRLRQGGCSSARSVQEGRANASHRPESCYFSLLGWRTGTLLPERFTLSKRSVLAQVPLSPVI